MNILKNIAIMITMLCNFNVVASSTKPQDIIIKLQESNTKANPYLEIKNKNVLTSGFYLTPPYQFNRVTRKGGEASGLDIELVNAIAAKIGIEVQYDEVDNWKQELIDLVDGKRDIGFGATYSNDRAKFMYFSTPYRLEINSLFMLGDSVKKLEFKNTPEFLAQIRLLNFRLGVVEGSVYGDQEINEFIDNEANSDIIFKYSTNDQTFDSLLLREIDGFICDRGTGRMLSLDKSVDKHVKEIPLGSKTPVHLIFSKKTVPIGLVDHFNQIINNFKSSVEYKNIFKSYLYQILLPKSLNTNGFYIINLIGILAFAVSGLIIANKENSTLFGAFTFAILPSIVSIIFRDIMINYYNNKIIVSAFYVCFIFIFVLIGFATIKLMSHYNKYEYLNNNMTKILDNIVVACDAIGQAIFIVIGFYMAIMIGAEPIWLCGAFVTFFTASVGMILRDFMRKNKEASHRDAINYEVSILFGIIFSVFLEVIDFYPSCHKIRYASIIIIISAFLTRIILHYFKIHNSRFRNEDNISRNI